MCERVSGQGRCSESGLAPASSVGLRRLEGLAVSEEVPFVASEAWGAVASPSALA